MPSQPKEPHRPIRIRPALKAMRRLLGDPDDTRQVFEIIEALSGNTGTRLLKRLRSTAEGRELLAQKPNILTRLSDHEALRQLPEGSLGRAYLAFLQSEGITSDGLVEASETGGASLTGDFEWLHHRLRDTHDLWHTVTGYRGDLIGEASLLAFSFAQTRNPGVGFIVLMSLLVGPIMRDQEPLRFPNGELAPLPRSLVIEGFLRGKRAAFLPALSWEALLERPLEEVRRELGVGQPPRYQPVRSSEVDLLQRRRKVPVAPQSGAAHPAHNPETVRGATAQTGSRAESFVA